jgi:glycosyltransferase involved in cell wall biosynthesis
MIEAMACGAPVLAMRRGSVAEVVEDGLTGHIVDSIEEATVTLPRVMTLDRRMACQLLRKAVHCEAYGQRFICACTMHCSRGRM